MSYMLRFSLVAFLGMCCLTGSALGQQSLIKRGETDPNQWRQDGALQSTRGTNRVGQSMQNVDSHFAACLQRANLAEVKLAKIAVERADSENVKQFAQQLIKDHSAIAEELAKLAADAGPIDRTAKIEQQINERCLTMVQAELESKSGKQFDTCFLGSQVAGHMRMIAALEVLASQTTGQLQQIVKSAQPTVQKHYDEAQRLMQGFDGRQASNRPVR
jgi:putative membrane protein